MAKRSLQHPIFETSWIDAEVVLDRSLATGDALELLQEVLITSDSATTWRAPPGPRNFVRVTSRWIARTSRSRTRAKLSRRPICTRLHLAAIYIRNLRIRHPQVTSGNTCGQQITPGLPPKGDMSEARQIRRDNQMHTHAPRQTDHRVHAFHHPSPSQAAGRSPAGVASRIRVDWRRAAFRRGEASILIGIRCE
jgi:hypothetical protein